MALVDMSCSKRAADESSAPPSKRVCAEEEEEIDVSDDKPMSPLPRNQPLGADSIYIDWNGIPPSREFYTAINKIVLNGGVGTIPDIVKKQAPRCRELRIMWRKSFSEISWLVFFTQLRLLVLNYNSITDISPLARLPQLKTLLLRDNQIEDISPIGEIKELCYLTIAYNAITDISPLARLPQLRTVFLDGNRIKDITPLSSLHRLRRVSLCHNQIEDFAPLSTCFHINYFSCESGNPLKKGAVDELRRAQTRNRAILALAASGLPVNKDTPIGRSFARSPLREPWLLPIIARFYR